MSNWKTISLLLATLIAICSCTPSQGRTTQRTRISNVERSKMKEAMSSKMILVLDTLDYDTAKTERSLTIPKEEFIIIARSNPSTGYDWQCTIEGDSDIVALDTVQVKQQNASPMIVGAPIMKEYLFSANKAGECVVRFKYARSWESKEPIAEGVYSIKVEE